MKNKEAPFLANLGMDFGSIQSKEYADKLQADNKMVQLNQMPVGTGPFTEVKNFQNQIYEVHKNPNYWQPGKPMVEGLRFPAYPGNDQTARYHCRGANVNHGMPGCSTAFGSLRVDRAVSDEVLRLLQSFGIAASLQAIEQREAGLEAEVAARLGEETNRNLYILSVVTVIFLPMTLITGIFGMNVDGLPGLQDPSAFWWVMLSMVGVPALFLLAIRWRRRP